MAKPKYNIRTSINRSPLDAEVSLEIFKIPFKPKPLKSIAYFMAAAIGLFAIYFQSPVGYLNLWFKVLFFIWYVATTAYFGSNNEADEFRFMQLPGLWGYLKKGARRIDTRSRDKPSDLIELTDIRDIEGNGLIKFADGTVGQMYSVVGSASLLLFDSDKALILNRVDSFWQKADVGPQWLTLTMKEPQRVYRPLAALARRDMNLKYRHESLDIVLEENKYFLQEHAGRNYESLHQYLLIKANNLTALRQAHRRLRGEAGNSSLMFRECEKLDGETSVEALSVLFKDREARKHDRMKREKMRTVAGDRRARAARTAESMARNRRAKAQAAGQALARGTAGARVKGSGVNTAKAKEKKAV